MLGTRMLRTQLIGVAHGCPVVEPRSWTLLVLYQARRTPREHRAWFVAGDTALEIRGGLVVCPVVRWLSRSRAPHQLWMHLTRSVVDPSELPRAQTVCAPCVLPSHAEVVVFDGRVTPHGTWVSPRANSTQWPFFGVALIVQSRAV